MTDEAIVIVSASRTPMGGFMGALSNVSAPELGSNAIKSAVEKSQIGNDVIDEVIMGCVLPAALGQAPARQAALGAGLSLSTTCLTINKVCGSGMKSVMMAHDFIKAGSANVVVAGGMESMTNAPHMLPNARAGYRMGSGELVDHMMFDGLTDAYDKLSMGCFAQDTADEYGITREQMDEFAISSLNKANEAIKKGHFAEEITPVSIQTRKGEIFVDTDEQPGKAMPEKIPSLRPAFKKDGTVTAANSSSISDGAAALLLMKESEALARGLKPLCRIKGHTMHAQKPSEFTIAPVGAIKKLLDVVGWNVDDVDLFEINEAFAMVTMLAINELGLDSNKVNVHGGACALGHPIGASGARLIVTLIHALKQRHLSKGIASLCIGGGEATAIAVEMIN